MKIGIDKIITIIILIIILLFEYQVVNNNTYGKNTFHLREYSEEEYMDSNPQIYFEGDYEFDVYGQNMVLDILDKLNLDKDYDISKYLHESFEEKCQGYEFEDLNDFLYNNISIKDKGNKYYITYRTEYVNGLNENVKIFDVVVLRKDTVYPDGFNILKEENNIDKEKHLAFHFVEYSSYNFSIYKIIK